MKFEFIAIILAPCLKWLRLLSVRMLRRRNQRMGCLSGVKMDRGPSVESRYHVDTEPASPFSQTLSLPKHKQMLKHQQSLKSGRGSQKKSKQS